MVDLGWGGQVAPTRQCQSWAKFLSLDHQKNYLGRMYRCRFDRMDAGGGQVGGPGVPLGWPSTVGTGTLASWP